MQKLPVRAIPTGPGIEFDVRVEAAILGLMDILRHELCVATVSFGKDSSAALVLILEAARRLRVNEPKLRLLPLIVLHGDTEVESPAVTDLAQDMMESLVAWAAAEGIDVRMHVYHPRLADTFAVNVLSGGMLPTYANSRRRQCANKWKVDPAATAMADILPALRKELAGDIEMAQRLAAVEVPVTIIGTRHEESARRSANMAARGENAIRVVEYDGRRLLAPLADWSEEDVWELLGTAGTKAKVYPVWRADFAETIQLYRDAASGECPVVVGTGKIGRAGCGARFGCHTCLAVQTDRSLMAMVEDPRHHHLRDLLRIRDFMSGLQYDWSRRSWLTRQFAEADGTTYVKIQPDHWDAPTLLSIVGAYLTADRREDERAAAFAAALDAGRDPNDPYVAECRKAGKEPDPAYMRRMRRPRFCVLTDRHIVALDWYSAVLGKYRRPFQVLELAYRVWRLGEDLDLPEIQPAEPSPAPAPLWLPITGAADPMPGLAEPLSVALGAGSCFGDDEVHGVGVDSFVANHARSFDVDPQAAAEIVDWFYEDSLREHHLQEGADPFYGVHALLTLGAVMLSPQGRTRLHGIVKQRQRLQENGLYDLATSDLVRRARPMPDLTQQVKRTVADQAEFLL